MKIQGVSASELVVCNAPKRKGELDSLEQSMQDYLHPKQSKRRFVGKLNPDDMDSSSGLEANSSSSDDSDQDLVAPLEPAVPPEPSAAGTAAAPTPRSSSFVFTEEQLGLRDIHIAATARSKCFICAQDIKKGELRGSWAFNCRKPHRYIHGTCIARIDGEKRQKAFRLVEGLLGNAESDLLRTPKLAEIHDRMQQQGM